MGAIIAVFLRRENEALHPPAGRCEFVLGSIERRDLRQPGSKPVLERSVGLLPASWAVL